MIVTRAPLRVSFFGGGTDYPDYFLTHGGAVLGSAIDQYSFITASRIQSKGLLDYSIRLTYREIELVDDVDGVKHVPMREALRRCGYSRDVEIHHIADLPAKTGLGSSSSFSVSLLQALNKLDGRDVAGLDLAYDAIEFERQTLGENVGCQDQTFAAVGGFNLIEFRGEHDIDVHPVVISDERLSELEDCLFMFYSGVSRRAEEVVKLQLGKVSANIERYKAMRGQVDRAHDILVTNKPLSAFGELLDEAWSQKRALHSVISNPVIDEMYARAKAAGALGGKLLGAGAGGFVLFFVPQENQAAVRMALADHHLVRPRLRAPGCSVIFDGTKMRAPQLSLRKVVG
jgi:D-glycero-alpha-D-manno-heptose-7-phosphate kinase